MSRAPEGTPSPFDPGLQPERTRLAWRRTLLSLAVGSLVALRVLPAAFGTWIVPVCVGGLLTAAGLTVLGSRRARAVDRALAGSTPLPGSGLPALLASAVSVGAVACLAAVLAA